MVLDIYSQRSLEARRTCATTVDMVTAAMVYTFTLPLTVQTVSADWTHSIALRPVVTWKKIHHIISSKTDVEWFRMSHAVFVKNHSHNVILTDQNRVLHGNKWGCWHKMLFGHRLNVVMCKHSQNLFFTATLFGGHSPLRHEIQGDVPLMLYILNHSFGWSSHIMAKNHWKSK